MILSTRPTRGWQADLPQRDGFAVIGRPLKLNVRSSQSVSDHLVPLSHSITTLLLFERRQMLCTCRRKCAIQVINDDHHHKHTGKQIQEHAGFDHHGHGFQ
jgi:hypothetical protein